jgi:hypothetical protein
MTADNSLRHEPTLRLTIDLKVGVEPVSGVLHVDGVEHPFEGWMELASALGKATKPAPQPL